MKCPKCRRNQYWVCGNKDCVCYKQVPRGAKPQINLKNDVVKCPYCGFKAHMDYWEEREQKIYWKLT